LKGKRGAQKKGTKVGCAISKLSMMRMKDKVQVHHPDGYHENFKPISSTLG